MLSKLRTSLLAAFAASLLVVPLADLSARAAAPADAEGKLRNEQLDALFQRLKTTPHEIEADTIVAEIWQLWMKSGRDDIDALMQQAVMFIGSGQLAEALHTLDQVVERAPDYAEGWNKRATVFYLLDEHTRSLADIDKTLSLEPRHFGALAGRGLVHAAEERWQAALDAYTQALAVNPFLKERHELIPLLKKKAEGQPL